MTIKAGDRMPSGKLKTMTAEGPRDISTDDLFKGKKVVLFSVPGAFTPTCDAKHLPGFIQNAEQLKAKGVDTSLEQRSKHLWLAAGWPNSCYDFGSAVSTHVNCLSINNAGLNETPPQGPNYRGGVLSDPNIRPAARKPPSTFNVWPWTYLLSSDDRKTAASAISSGVP